MKKIRNELRLVKFFLEHDFKTVMLAFDKEASKDSDRVGCYSLLRIIFPLVDHMAQLVAGKATKAGSQSKVLRDYIYDCMGQINPKYKQCAGLIVYMYRHGLLHQLHPNRIKHNNAIVEWCLYYKENNKEHLECKSEKKKKRLYFDIEQFADDFLKSIDLYEKLLVGKKGKEGRDKFRKAIKDMSSPLIPGTRNKGWLVKEDFLILDSYNQGGFR